MSVAYPIADARTAYESHWPQRGRLAHTDAAVLPVMFVTTDMTMGGHEQMIARLALGMDRSRFAPIVCCLKQRGDLGQMLAEAGVPVYADLSAHKFDARVLVRLVRVMRTHRVGLVCTVGTGGDRMFWGRLAARLAGVPRVVASLHSMGEPDHVEWPNRLLNKMTDAFVGVARVQRQYLTRHEGIPPERTHVIYNGVDARVWARAQPSAQLARSLGLQPGTPVAGIVAILRPEKNHEMFLQAAARVVDLVPNAHFLVVGDGPQREDLTCVTHQLGLTWRVHFIGQRNDVPQLMKLMDVVVLSSRAEAFPMTILEGMAAGRPIVATDVGAIGEAVSHGTNGYLVAHGDTDAMAQSIARLMTDSDRARRFGQAGQRLVAERFSLRQMIEGYERLFLSLAPLTPGDSPGARDNPRPFTGGSR